METYEVYAIHYAHNPNARRANNFIGGDPHDGPMPLDYFVWAIKGPDLRELPDGRCRRHVAQYPSIPSAV